MPSRCAGQLPLLSPSSAVAVPPSPSALPLASVPGCPAIVKHAMLNDRRHVLSQVGEGRRREGSRGCCSTGLDVLQRRRELQRDTWSVFSLEVDLFHCTHVSLDSLAACLSPVVLVKDEEGEVKLWEITRGTVIRRFGKVSE